MTKKHGALLLILFALIFVEVIFELKMPGFTSRVVEEGINTKGVEHILPEAMTEKNSDELTIFMTGEEKKVIERIYEERDGVFWLKETDEQTLTEYDETFMTPFLVFYELFESNDEAFVKALGKAEGFIDDELYEDAVSGKIGREEFAQRLDLNRRELAKLRDRIRSEASDTDTAVLMGAAKRITLMLDENAGVDTSKMQNMYLKKQCLLMVGFMAISFLCALVSNYLVTRIGTEYAASVQKKIYRKVFRFRESQMKKHKVVSLVNRTVGDVDAIGRVGVMLLRNVTYALVTGVSGLVFLAFTGASMTWIVILALLVMLGYSMIFVPFVLSGMGRSRKALDEIVKGLFFIRSYGREGFMEERFDKVNRGFTKKSDLANRLMMCVPPAVMLITNLTVTFVIWVGAVRGSEGQIQAGTVIEVVSYSQEVLLSFLLAAAISVYIPEAVNALKRVREVLDEEVLDEPEKNAVCLPGSREELKGKVIVITGERGSGKSVLARRIAFENNAAYVPQDPMFITNTIAYNLRAGRDEVTEDEMIAAAKLAKAYDFISERENGFDSKMMRAGLDFSGGQKQRLAVARALIGNPEMIVFDDSFSALDMQTKVEVLDNIIGSFKDTTIIIATADEYVIDRADSIIRLSEVGQNEKTASAF